MRKLALVSLIWLTAASTLFASLPHIECRCPNGRLKLICLTSLLGSSACCGKATCCDEAKPPPPASGQGCCCKRPAAKPTVSQSQQTGAAERQAQTGAGHVKRDGCTRRLIQPGLGVLTYTRAVSATQLELARADLQVPPAADPLVPVALPSTNISADLYRHAPAPPDLVIVLQHFLI